MTGFVRVPNDGLSFGGGAVSAIEFVSCCDVMPCHDCDDYDLLG